VTPRESTFGHPSITPKVNQLLAAIPEAVYRRLVRDLEVTTLNVGETLFLPAGQMQFAYFPTTSIVAMGYAVEAEGAMAKAWPVGREGMVGISLFLGGLKRYSRADVQIGGFAYRLPEAAVLAEIKRAGAFRHLLMRYVFALVTQASQLGVCNHYHPIEQRLCRFLLRLFDRVPGTDVVITQERIGELLGVRRGSITCAASQLQAAGIIEYRRGHIRLISPKKLEEHSCACAAIIRGAFETMFV